jgi:hypothetical protein
MKAEAERRRKDLELLADFIPDVAVVRMEVFQFVGEGPALRDRRS